MSLTHLVLESLSDEALDAACIQRLQARGYVCEIPHDWERIGDFARRLRVSSTFIVRKLDDPRCPLPQSCIQRARNTETRVGRRTHLAPTAAFEKFCLENK